MRTMHMLVATVGTRGDVQPYVALGLGLRRAGHEVTLATHCEHAMHHAEASRLPLAVAAPILVLPSREAPPVFMPRAPRWGWLRKWLTEQALDGLARTMRDLHDPYRARLGLPPLGNAVDHLLAMGVPFLGIYSEVLAPRPSDWPHLAQVTGFCMLPRQEGWTPPPALADFLESGSAPVQPYWGEMAARLGTGPRPIKKQGLDAARLARGITALLSEPSHADVAARVAGELREEDGVAATTAAVLAAFERGEQQWERRGAA